MVCLRICRHLIFFTILGDYPYMSRERDLFDDLVFDASSRLDDSLEPASLDQKGLGCVVLRNRIGIAIGPEHRLSREYSFHNLEFT